MPARATFSVARNVGAGKGKELAMRVKILAAIVLMCTSVEGCVTYTVEPPTPVGTHFVPWSAPADNNQKTFEV